MISRYCLEEYSKLILELIDTYSEDTAVLVADFVSTDEICRKTRGIFDKCLSEFNFVEEMKSIGMPEEINWEEDEWDE